MATIPEVNRLMCIGSRILNVLVVITLMLVPVQAQSEDPETAEILEEIKALRAKLAEMEQIKERLDELEAKLRSQQPVVVPSAPEPPVPAPPLDQPGPTLDIYGFVMTDIGGDFGQTDPDWFDVVRPTKLPAFNNEFGRDGNSYFSVRQSRFGVQGHVPTDLGELFTHFEWELFGVGPDAGQTTIRLRHAYGELGQFGAGQYWSPFMDIDVFPNSIEYWGPSGMAFFRNVQFRWMPIKGDSRLTFALERPGASGDRGRFADRVELDGIKGRFPVPDVSGEYRHGGDWGYVEAAGIYRRIEWIDILDDEYDLSGTANGWGVNFSSNIIVGDQNKIKLQLLYGKGIENYMNDAPQDIGPVLDLSDPVRPLRGETLPVLGLVAFYDHYWNPRLSSSAGYSLVNIENTMGQEESAFSRGHYALGNLLFSPVKDVMFGGEFQFGRRENFLDGWRYNDFRFQFSFKYNYQITLGAR